MKHYSTVWLHVASHCYVSSATVSFGQLTPFNTKIQSRFGVFHKSSMAEVTFMPPLSCLGDGQVIILVLYILE